MDAATSRVTFQGENHTLPLNQSKLIIYQNFFFQWGLQRNTDCMAMLCYDLFITFFLIVAFPTTDFLIESKFSQNFPLALLRIPHTLVQ